MPRPAATPESDDILSSLRRLVSDTDEAATAEAAPSGEPAHAAEEAAADASGESPDGRLILTPALRVGGNEAEAQTDEHREAMPDDPANDPGEAARTGETDAAAADPADMAGLQPEEPEPATDRTGHGETGASHRRRLHLDTTDDEEDTRPRPADFAEGQEAATTVSAGAEEEAEEENEAEGMAQAQEKPDFEPAATDDREPEDILRAEEAEERILDEDTLREIVVQTVREELMGELGERITRNVKKLVRREIHRALASREFDQ